MKSISLEKTTYRASLTSWFALAVALSLSFLSMATPVQAQNTPGKIFFYSSASLQGASGMINHADPSFTTWWGPVGGFAPWFIVVSGGVDILFYDAATGRSIIGQLNPQGVFINTQPIPDEIGRAHV